MVKDITNKIIFALSQSSLWNRNKFLTHLEVLAQAVKGGILDWDEYAGENWGRVLTLGEPIVYLHKSAPIIFIQENFQNLVAQSEDLHCLLFSHVDEEIYALDEKFFEQWSEGRSKSGGLKNESLSVSDIWWATVL
ncbi:MAG: hypothetical protein KME12_08775 [Trichocoleus desertorum ATA4-8-CV12]|jgi:hypothetical protein|nr:hypothetical protein [Trichocoleus desertorum ATA4-8-CV12]